MYKISWWYFLSLIKTELKAIHFVNSVCTIFSLWKKDHPHQTFPSQPELTSAVSLLKQDPCAELFTQWMDFSNSTIFRNLHLSMHGYETICKKGFAIILLFVPIYTFLKTTTGRERTPSVLTALVGWYASNLLQGSFHETSSQTACTKLRFVLNDCSDNNN